MSVKLSAFPKCYIDQIAGARTMSLFDWMRMGRSLDADGLEMYEGFFLSLDDDYLDRAAFRQVDGTSYYHRLQIQEFLRAILEGRPAPVPGEEGRRVVAMFTAIYRSQREHRPIQFPLAT